MLWAVISFRRRLIRAQWEMVRVRECWGALECNRGSTRLSPLAAQQASGLADRSAAIPVNAAWTGQNVCPLEKLWWGESDLDSPLARLPCLVHRAAETALHADCRYGTGDSIVKLLGQSKSIHDRYDLAGMHEITTSSRTAQTPRGIVVKLASVRSLTYPRCTSACNEISLRPIAFRENNLYLHHRNIWTPIRSPLHFSVCSPTGPMSLEQVPIDPDVMVAVDQLVFSICG